MDKEEAIKDLEEMKSIEFTPEHKTKVINTVLAELEGCEKKVKMLTEEREYIKNNLEVNLNKKGVYSQAKGQIAQILEYYENNEKYLGEE